MPRKKKITNENDYEKLLDYCKNIMDNNEGYLYGDKISIKMRKKITKCGVICEIRKKLHGEKFHLGEKFHGEKITSVKKITVKKITSVKKITAKKFTSTEVETESR